MTTHTIYSAYEFASKVDLDIESLPFDNYHLKTRCCKRLREEWLPLSRLGLYFKKPGLNVSIKVSDVEEYNLADAYICISGYYDDEITIQITFAGYDRNDKLRAELLISDGIAPGAGEIEKDRKTGKITASSSCIDYDEYLHRIAAAVQERFQEKCKKPYDTKTVLLIAFDEYHLCDFDNWAYLISHLKVSNNINPFRNIYLFNSATNDLHLVPNLGNQSEIAKPNLNS